MASITTLQKDLASLNRKSRLSSAVEDVDKIIELLQAARDEVAATLDPHTAGLTMTKLQNPVKEKIEVVNEDLKKVSKVQKEFGRALDKSFPLKPLLTEHDVMKDQLQLINRAIAMHLLREGQFNVASSFIEEAAADLPTGTEAIAPDGEPDVDMDSSVADLPALLRPEELQSTFAEMYKILQEIKGRNLGSAIDWARRHSQQLEDRGSNLEFELCKLQFIWLFKGSSDDTIQSRPAGAATTRTTTSDPGSPSQPRHYQQSVDQANHLAALAYARSTFSRFQDRHLPEIRQLAAAMLYAPNLRDSPYDHIFASPTAFSDVSTTFTREFCSLLGLSAESPLYIAVTAGALALPQLMKYVARVAHRRTEWTTASELAFETPLPASMMYHSIFVCPVSKDQTTDANPPMWLPGCGHVLARESLQNLAKGNRFKCPYCPTEGLVKDAKQIWL